MTHTERPPSTSDPPVVRLDLRTVRQLMGMNLRQFAKELQISGAACSISYLHLVETGKRTPSERWQRAAELTIERLARK